MTQAVLDRVIAQVQTIKPLRALFGILAAPFYAVGLIAGLVWFVAFYLIWSALAVGFRDGVRKQVS